LNSLTIEYLIPFYIIPHGFGEMYWLLFPVPMGDINWRVKPNLAHYKNSQ